MPPWTEAVKRLMEMAASREIARLAIEHSLLNERTEIRDMLIVVNAKKIGKERMAELETSADLYI